MDLLGAHLTEFNVFYSIFAGRRHVRINLSEQSDMMDLLGADLPVEGGLPGVNLQGSRVFLPLLQGGATCAST